MLKSFALKIKESRDRFSNKILTLNAFKKASFRLRQQEKVYAYVANDKNDLKFPYAPLDLKIGPGLVDADSWQS